MKQLLVILLSILILLNPISRTWIVVSYQINQKYIAQNLCENRAKPQMKCNGKCHLKKQLEKANKDEQKTPQNLTEKVEVLFCSQLGSFHFQAQSPIESQSPPRCFYKQMHSQLYLTDIFHPPTLA
ncbi:MAG: hypothetical protein KA783_04780 [Chitinophagales bacterium]|nr:hypothetical protein [Sphingobacteriales bacterium]MBP6663679.1 hypothetical protein [Chitinophagales bacterium]MBP7533738.1 hypothetical protein [Chitinophagales bacterium]